MQIVRVAAEFQEGWLFHQDYKIVLLCGIDENHQLIYGEWMGYVQNKTIRWPFILKIGKLSSFYFGREDHLNGRTDLPDGAIKVGRLFTLGSSYDKFLRPEATYEIVSCHAY